MIEKRKNSIMINDINIRYYKCGHGNRTLLLFHGNNENANIFEHYLEFLPSNIKAYAIDSRGHGTTDAGDKPFSIKTMAIDFMRFINAKPFKKVMIIGYSDGANIALRLASLAPELVDRMVLISPNIFASALPKKFLAKLRCKYYLVRPFVKLSKKAMVYQSKLELMLNDVGLYEEDLTEIKVPSLVIRPKNDLIEKSHIEMISKNLQNAEFVQIKDANHFNVIHKEEFFSLVNDFLDKDLNADNETQI